MNIWVVLMVMFVPLVAVLSLYIVPSSWNASNDDWENVAGAGGDWRGAMVGHTVLTIYFGLWIAAAVMFNL